MILFLVCQTMQTDSNQSPASFTHRAGYAYDMHSDLTHYSWVSHQAGANGGPEFSWEYQSATNDVSIDDWESFHQ